MSSKKYLLCSKGKIMTFSDKIETVKNELTLKEQLMNVIQEEKMT